MNDGNRCWAVVPAAGIGRRMGAPIPKQYLRLGARLVIDHALARLLDHPRIAAVAVSLSAEDSWWPDTVYAGHGPANLFRPGAGQQ